MRERERERERESLFFTYTVISAATVNVNVNFSSATVEVTTVLKSSRSLLMSRVIINLAQMSPFIQDTTHPSNLVNGKVNINTIVH